MAKKKVPKRHPGYPWKEWFQLPQFKLTKGKDFEVSMDGMQQMVSNWASRLKVPIRMVVGDETIVVINMSYLKKPKKKGVKKK